MELGEEKTLSLGSSCKESKPSFVFSVGDALGRDAAVDEPVSDFIFGLLRGAEGFNNFF